MAVLIVGLILFLGVHSLSIVNEPLRNRLHTSLGEGAFKGLYSLVSLVGLVLIVWGYGSARMDPTVDYTPPGWLRHLAMLLLIQVFPAADCHPPGQQGERRYCSGRRACSVCGDGVLGPSMALWCGAGMIDRIAPGP